MAEKYNNLLFIGKIRSLYISCSGNFASQLINERSNNILCYGSGTFNITDVTAWNQKYSELLPSLNAANWLTIMYEIFHLIWLLNGKI